jgi:hypothetical protein
MNIEAFAGGMKTSSLRHKYVQLDQRKLNRALRILGARTETEALDRALSVVVSEDKSTPRFEKPVAKDAFEKSSNRMQRFKGSWHLFLPRAGVQSENGQADRPDDPAVGALPGGQGDQVTRTLGVKGEG